jgi:polysaccharide pyruvyl transferase WcaK-like protein
MTTTRAARIAVLHGINYYNAGDHGIVYAMLVGLQGIEPRPSITLLSPFLDANAERRDFIARAQAPVADGYPPEVPDLYQVPAGRAWGGHTLFEMARTGLVVTLLTILPRPIGRWVASLSAFGRAILDSDIVVSKGGGFLLDRGARYIVPLHLASIWCAIRLGKPVVIFAQTVGPFDRPLARRIASFVLKRVRWILVRDDYSVDVCTRVLGVGADRVARVGDAAFLLARLPDGSIGAPAGADDPRSGAAMSLVAPRFAGIKGDEAEERFVDLMSRVVSGIAERLGRPTTIIPHLESGPSNDRELAERIVGRTGGASVASILDVAHPARIVRTLAGREFAICTRMHSMIFSIVAGTPFVGISYLPKTDSLLRELGLGDWIVPMHEVIADPVAGSARVERIAREILADHGAALARVRRARESALLASEAGVDVVARLARQAVEESR